MITHRGKVISIGPGRRALVRLGGISSAESCAGCAMASACRPAAGGSGIAVEAGTSHFDESTLLGRHVRVESRTGSFGAAMSLFALPTAALVGGAVLAKHYDGSDAAAAAWGLGACALCFLAAAIVRRMRRPLLWQISEIIENQDSSETQL